MPNDDGTFSVYINERVDDVRKRRAYKHEIEHIENNDFYNEKPIEEIENI